MKLNQIFRYVIPFVAAFSLIACEDDSISGSTIPSYPIEPIQEPGTQEPGTQEPGTQEPGTQEPGTQEPGTQEPGTQDPQDAAILLAASATDIEIPYKGFTKAQVLLVGIAGEHAGELLAAAHHFLVVVLHACVLFHAFVLYLQPQCQSPAVVEGFVSLHAEHQVRLQRVAVETAY